MVTIKKYSNRKLYNTNSKKYVTLVEIANLLREGNDISIIDHKTGQDITSPILAQIIFEYDKQEQTSFSKNIFTQIILDGAGLIQSLTSERLALGQVNHQVNGEIQRRINLLIVGTKISPDKGKTLSKLLVTDWDNNHETENQRLKDFFLKNIDFPTNQDLDDLNSNLENLANAIEKLFSSNN